MGAVIVLEDGTTIVPYNSDRTGVQMDRAMDRGDSVGDISQLTTTDKSSIVGAINEISDVTTEVVQARVDTNGETHLNLKDRLDSEYDFLKVSLNQYHTDVYDKYVRYEDGIVLDYPNNNLITTSFPVSEGMALVYDYTRSSPDARGLAFFDVTGAYISGVQTIATSQTIVVPLRAVLVKATVTDPNQIRFNNIVNAISEVMKITNIASMRTISQSGQLSSADDVEVNKIYTIYTSSHVQNLPISDNRGGLLFTFYNGKSSAGKAQIFISSDNVLYSRISWANGWGTWQNYRDTIISKGIIDSTALGNCDSATPNSVYSVNDTAISNLPTAKKGVLFCVCGSPNSKANITGGKVQFYITEDGNSVFYRCTRFAQNATWTSWKAFGGNDKNTPIATNMTATPLEYIRNDAGLLSCFHKVGCIGDSLSSGECVYRDSNGTHGVDLYEHSWGQYLAKMTGNTYYNFSVGGLSAKTFHTTNNAKVREFEDADKVCDMYFIGLGQNDYNAHNSIGTSADIDFSNYNNNADSYYGNYAKIIQKIKEKQPKAKIFVFTDPLNAVENTGYNDAVRSMATLFSNVYVLDMYTYGNAIYRGSGSFIYNQNRVGHYNAIAYKAMANITATYVDWIMKTNPSEFSQVEFIGTNYNY